MKIASLITLIFVIAAGSFVYRHEHDKAKLAAQSTTPTQLVQPQKTTTTTTPKPTSSAPTVCGSNRLPQLALVSISQRHMWACAGSKQVYDSAVITGMDFLAADLTPTGTYKIYAKQTNQHLIGSDSTGHWNDFVYYWLPFLSNQYGIYGFHDATWRSNSDFGQISPDSKNASHGCVELPLATAKWLYSWAQVGTTVKIQS